MNVKTEDIRNIRPGEVQPFPCENALAMHSACSLVYRLKRFGMPDGVVDYETKKDYGNNILMIHALKEGDKKIF